MNKAAAMQLAAMGQAALGTAAQGIAGAAASTAAYLGAGGADAPRGGLQKFIQEIRDCTSKEAEQARVDKELANVRAKFSSTGGLTSYRKKKYVWKLVYIYMLGYEVEFGHMEMISLISSPKHSEKAVGYIAVSLLLRSGDEMMTLVINSMRNDLQSHSNPAQTLALATIANLGGADLREGLAADVQKLLLRSDGDPCVRKKAALCLLRFFRENPANPTLVHSEWASSMSALLEDKHLGVVTSCMALLVGFAAAAPAEYEALVPYVVLLLTRLTVHKTCQRCYLYYDTPAPWLQVKLLRFLQLYPPPADAGQRAKLGEALTKILTRTEVSESVNKSNADHSILFEAINLIIHQGEASDAALRIQAMTLLGRFIAVKEPNIRYLGLETMSRLARLEGNESIKRHKATVMVSLKDADISMRRRALDLLFVISDRDNAVEIVEELMAYLALSDAAIREEMVLKIAILAEKFTNDLRWYVDTVLQMISIAGDHVGAEVWHRIVQIVTNNKDLQAYAAERLFGALRAKRVHQTAVNVGGYILGEFGFFIAEQEGMGGDAQFAALHQHFADASPGTRALLLSTYAKLANLYPECRALVTPVFEKYAASNNLELQQRSCEYMALPKVGLEVMEEVLKEMPPFPENRESGPEARLRERLEKAEQGALGGDQKPSANGGPEGEEEEAAAPAPPTPPPVVNDLLDVGGDDDNFNFNQPPPAPTSPSAAPSSPPRQQQQQVMPSVPMGLATAVQQIAIPPSVAGFGDAVGIPPELAPQLLGWFRNLTVQQQGVLFETPALRVGVVHEYRASQGRVLVYYYNLAAEAMENFTAEVVEPPHMRMQVQAVPPTLDAGGQTKQQVMCEAMQPFTDALELRIEFDRGGRRHVYPLRLPVVATSFMEPAPLSPEDFAQRWQMLAGENREQQEVLVATQPVTPQYMAALREKITAGMKMGVTAAAASDFVITAAGTFKTGSAAPNGTKISVGTMLMVEGNPQANAVRITARAVHGKVAQAVKNVVRLHI